MVDSAVTLAKKKKAPMGGHAATTRFLKQPTTNNQKATMEDWIRQSFSDLLNPALKSENVSHNVPQMAACFCPAAEEAEPCAAPIAGHRTVNLELLVGALSIHPHNLRKRPMERKLPYYAAPDNFEFEFAALDDSGNQLAMMGDELRTQGLFRLVMELRKQVPPPSRYGNINRLLEPDEWGEFTEDNLILALAEQIAITKGEFTMHNVRRGANLLKLLREVQMSSKLIASGASGRAASGASSS